MPFSHIRLASSSDSPTTHIAPPAHSPLAAIPIRMAPASSRVIAAPLALKAQQLAELDPRAARVFERIFDDMLAALRKV